MADGLFWMGAKGRGGRERGWPRLHGGALYNFLFITIDVLDGRGNIK